MTKFFNNRFEFKLVIHLFCEGKTELDYLQKFVSQEYKRDLVRINGLCINPNPVYLAKEAIKNFDKLKNNKSEIWLVFDYDNREAEVKEAIELVRQSRKNIHIGFMKPCIEIWPLLHNGIDNITNQQAAQSKLEEIMPSYKHDRYPYFDLSKMPNYEMAVQKAKAWEISLNGESEYNASKFAGIYKFTERIKNI